MTTSPTAPTLQLDRPLARLHLARAGLAVLWAIAFALVSSELGGVAIALLIVYPAIDVAASVHDARTHPDASRTQWLNAGVSTAALIGVTLAASLGGNQAVLHVFGTWAAVSGVIQLVVAVRRRRLGRQWAMLLSGGLSTLAGIGFNLMATSDDPSLTNIAGYAGLGGVFFAVSAFLLRTRVTPEA